jgi:ubiquinol-cytochrome c reductase iron-sulfur subunit
MTDADDGRTCTRRDFVVWAAAAFAGVGCVAAAWPFVAQMAPNSGSRRDTVETDVGTIEPGRLKVVRWKTEPVLIRRRTPEEVELSRRVELGSLIDPLARVPGVDPKAQASDANRARNSTWLVVIGVCTRCACLIKEADRNYAASPDEVFFCPCCASWFDLAGRARRGPAPRNLIVPPYRFIAPARIEIG